MKKRTKWLNKRKLLPLILPVSDFCSYLATKSVVSTVSRNQGPGEFTSVRPISFIKQSITYVHHYHLSLVPYFHRHKLLYKNYWYLSVIRHQNYGSHNRNICFVKLIFFISKIKITVQQP